MAVGIADWPQNYLHYMMAMCEVMQKRSYSVEKSLSRQL